MKTKIYLLLGIFAITTLLTNLPKKIPASMTKSFDILNVHINKIFDFQKKGQTPPLLISHQEFKEKEELKIKEMEKIAEDTEDLESLKTKYKIYSISEIKEKIKVKNKILRESRLIEKSNEGVLRKDEMKSLAILLKENNALSLALLEKQISAMKRKYL